MKAEVIHIHSSNYYFSAKNRQVIIGKLSSNFKTNQYEYTGEAKNQQKRLRQKTKIKKLSFLFERHISRNPEQTSKQKKLVFLFKKQKLL